MNTDSNMPQAGDYGYGEGIDPEIIDYIKESTVVQSRISSMPAYLFFMKPTGSVVDNAGAPLIINTFSTLTPNPVATIWPTGSLAYPDARSYTNNGQGQITVMVDSVPITRIDDPADLAHDNEFSVVERKDILPQRVEVVFNAGFDPSGHTITYSYTSMESGINNTGIESGQGTDQSLFGWQQWLDPTFDDFRGPNQVLVRLPIAVESLVINEEGKVKLHDNQSWMIWTPLVHERDILVFTSQYTFTGGNEIYEIINLQLSIIQGSLITQRFKLTKIEESDPRYKLVIQTV
jgi:hypothetical protein